MFVCGRGLAKQCRLLVECIESDLMHARGGGRAAAGLF